MNSCRDSPYSRALNQTNKFNESRPIRGGVGQLSPLSSPEEKHGFLVHVTNKGKTLLVSVVFLQIQQNLSTQKQVAAGHHRLNVLVFTQEHPTMSPSAISDLYKHTHTHTLMKCSRPAALNIYTADGKIRRSLSGRVNHREREAATAPQQQNI